MHNMKATLPKLPLAVLALTFFVSACTVVRQGEVGVQRTLGKYEDRVNNGGLEFFNPFTATVVKIPVRTENLEVYPKLPSKEGLNIRAVISILYRVDAAMAPQLLRSVGKGYEKKLILPVFRSAVADVSSRFLAKDMHTGSRAVIEQEIQDRMEALLKERGIIVEEVLIKNIHLPENLARAIEEKLQAEQRSLRMQFVLSQAKQEAERKRIEAEGVRQAQEIIAKGLTPAILQFKSIEAFLKLAQSPNSKIIVTDGDMPKLVTPVETTPGM